MKYIIFLILPFIFISCFSNTEESDSGSLFDNHQKTSNFLTVTPPASATYIETTEMNFTVNTIEATIVSGIPRITITIGSSTKHAIYTSGSGSTNLTFKYIIENGLSDTDGILLTSPIDLNGGTMKNSEGANLALGFVPPATDNILVNSTIPVVTITTPANGTFINTLTSGTYNISGSCTEESELVSLDIGGISATPTCSSQAWNVIVDTTSLSDGPITITANHSDALGVQSVQAEATVTKDTVNPTIAIDTPTNLTVIATPQDSVTYNVSGTCNENLKVINIQMNGVDATGQVGFVCDGTNFTGTINTTSHADLAYVMSAEIIDSAGNKTISNVVNITKDTTGAEITSIIAPSSGTYAEGSSIDFQVIYNKTVTVIASPCFDINIGVSTVSACYTGGSGSTAIFFSYTISSGNSDLDGISTGTTIAGGSINDSIGNASEVLISADMPDLTSILVDTSIVAPDQVTSVNQTSLSSDRMSASFTWGIPNDNGSAITEYLVRYRLIGNSEFTYHSPSVSSNSVTITGLIPDSNYEVQIAASSSVVGAYSSTLTFSTEFNPASLGALIWYEAKDINGTGVAPADGASISTLIDKSGHGNNATKIGTTAATIESVNGHKVLRLTSTGYATISSLGEGTNTDVEVYMIAKTRSITQSFGFSNENEAYSKRYGTHFPWSNSNAYIDLPIGNRMSGSWGGNTSDFFAWTFRSSTTQGKALERNGTQILSGGNKTITAPLKKWSIGSNYAGALVWQADLQAVFVFEKILDTTQRSDFFDYIESNYGVIMN